MAPPTDQMRDPALSVLIVHRDRTRALAATLATVVPQVVTLGAFEIIVVDDDSGAAESARARDLCEGAHGVFVSTSEGARGAAAARNAGLERATGRWVLLLDCDIMCPPGLFEAVLREGCEPRLVGFIPVAGAHLSSQTVPFVAPTCLVEPGPSSRAEDIAAEPLARDIRLEYCEPRSGRFGHHPAPWVFCWTHALLIDADLLRHGLRFGDRYAGKGSEDIAFGFELARQGAVFRMLDVPSAWHLPHARARSQEERRDREHERFFLQQRPVFEVEMLCAFGADNTGAAIQALNRVRTAPAARLHPRIPTPGSTLFLFQEPSEGFEAVATENPSWFAHPAIANAQYPEKLGVLGLALPFRDQELQNIVVPDLRGLLPESLVCRVLQEASRVADTVYLCLESRITSGELLVSEAEARVFDRPYWERSHYLSRSYFDWRTKLVGHEGAHVLLRVVREHCAADAEALPAAALEEGACR